MHISVYCLAMTNPEPPPGTPTAPLELAGGAANVSARIDSASVTLSTDFLQELGNACADISVDAADARPPVT